MDNSVAYYINWFRKHRELSVDALEDGRYLDFATHLTAAFSVFLDYLEDDDVVDLDERGDMYGEHQELVMMLAMHHKDS
jgi:hypothetical protein